VLFQLLTGQLTCTGAAFSNPKGAALDVEQLVVGNNLFLRRVQCTGRVRLFGAHIGAQLDCDGAAFSNADGTALYADGLTVDDIR
jgi:hypothetical protein